MIRRNMITVLLLVGTLCLPVHAAKIVFTSNAPELFDQENGYSIAKMAAFVKNLRQDEEVLFIHGGDSLSPSPLSVYDKGAHMISILNALGVDVMGINRREFNNGIDQVSLHAQQAQFPMVLSNLLDNRTMAPVEGVLPYVITTLGDKKIAVLMAISDSVNSTFLFNKSTVDESAEHISTLADQARGDGADYVILITERKYLNNQSVSKSENMDLVFVTHDAKDYVEGRQPVIVHAGGIDDEITVVDVAAGQQPKAQVVHLANQKADSDMQDVIHRYTSQLDVVLNQKLVTITAPMDSLKRTLRSQESSWGNIVMDAIRHYTDADFAAMIGGSMRGYREYPAGSVITRRDVQRELPFGGSVYVVDVDLAQLKQVLEHGVSKVNSNDGRFLQVSGLRYEYDLKLPVGQRILNIMDAEGRPLKNKHYSLAISDYMLNGGDDYDFSAMDVLSDGVSSQRLIWNIVSDYLNEFKTIEPGLEGRITAHNLP